MNQRVTGWRPRLLALCGSAVLLLSACGDSETPSDPATPAPNPPSASPVEPPPVPSDPEDPSEPPEEPASPQEPEPSPPADEELPPFPEQVGDYTLAGQTGVVGGYTNTDLDDDFYINITYSEVRAYDAGAGSNANERHDEKWFCHDTDLEPPMRWCATSLNGNGHVSFMGDTEEGTLAFAEEFLELWP